MMLRSVSRLVLEYQSFSILALGGLRIRSTAMSAQMSLKLTEIWRLYRKFVWCC